MAESYDHAPDVWTAGRLRAAIHDLPDDTPLHIAVAPEPGDFEGYEERVLTGYEPVELVWEETRATPERTEVQHTLLVDWPADTYEKIDD